MKTLPTPDDGLGVRGCVRTFTLDAIAWRAFEYRSPINPSTRPSTLIVMSSANDHYEVTTFPAAWRTMDAVELMRIVKQTAEGAGPRHSPPFVQRIPSHRRAS